MLKQEFDEYKPTVDAIKQDLDVTKNELIPPPGTIMGWVSKFHPDDGAVVELPSGKDIYHLVQLCFCTC